MNKLTAVEAAKLVLADGELSSVEAKKAYVKLGFKEKGWSDAAVRAGAIVRGGGCVCYWRLPGEEQPEEQPFTIPRDQYLQCLHDILREAGGKILKDTAMSEAHRRGIPKEEHLMSEVRRTLGVIMSSDGLWWTLPKDPRLNAKLPREERFVDGYSWIGSLQQEELPEEFQCQR